MQCTLDDIFTQQRLCISFINTVPAYKSRVAIFMEFITVTYIHIYKKA